METEIFRDGKKITLIVDYEVKKDQPLNIISIKDESGRDYSPFDNSELESIIDRCWDDAIEQY